MKKKRFYYPLIRSVVVNGTKCKPPYFGAACGVGPFCIRPFLTCSNCVYNICPE